MQNEATSNIVMDGPLPVTNNHNHKKKKHRKKHRKGHGRSGKGGSCSANDAAVAQLYAPQPAPPQLFIHFPPGNVGLGLSTAHLSHDAVHGVDNKAELEIPAVLREREAGPEPYDLENSVDDMPMNMIEHEVERIAEDLRKRKQALLIFLALEIMYSTFLLTLTFGRTSTSSNSNGSSSNPRPFTSSNLWVSTIAAALITNIIVDVITCYAATRNMVWWLNVYLVIEGLVISFFLFITLSPLVLLRMAVFLVAAQVRTRIIMLNSYGTLLFEAGMP